MLHSSMRKRQRTSRKMDTNGSSQISELQAEIERHLEEIKAQRPICYSKILNLDSSRNSGNVEDADTDKFINQSTIGIIKNCLSSKEVEAEINEPVGLGPSDALMGLDGKCNNTTSAENMFPDDTGELDLEGIDDEEIGQYIMSEKEASNKGQIWMDLNATYLEKQKEKEGRLAKTRDEGKPEKKRRKGTGKKNKNMPSANSAGEAIEKMLQENKISSKINYDVLKSLNVSIKEDGAANTASVDAPKQTEPEIVLPSPKIVNNSKRAKATPRVHKVKSEMKTEHVRIKQSVEETIVPTKTKNPLSVEKVIAG